MTAPCGHVDVNLKRGGAVLAGDSCRAVAINYLLAARAVAQHRVGVPLAAAHLILAELNHADFRVKGFRVLNRAGELLFRNTL